MNKWHQQLVILGAKIFAVLCGLLFVGFILYYNVYFKQDSLIKYVPKEAVAYATFRIKPESQVIPAFQKITNQLEAFNLPEIRFDLLTHYAGNNFSLAVLPPIKGSNQYQFLILNDLGYSKDIDPEYLNAWHDQGWQTHVFTNKSKSKKILALASSTWLLEQTKKTATKQVSALSENINLVMKFRTFSPDKFFGKLYLDRDYISSQLGNHNTSGNKLLSALLNNRGQEILIGGIKLEQGRISLQTDPEITDFQTIGQEINDLPEQTEYSFTFNDIASAWSTVSSWLQKNEPSYYEQLSKNKEYLEDLYDIDLNQQILPMINQSVQVILRPDNKFLISAKLAETQATDQVEQIEKLLKTYLATSYPVAKQKQLPDYTEITQIVRDIEQVQIIEDQLAGLKIKLLNYNNQEFSYILSGNSIILANDRDIIIDSLKNDQLITNWQKTGNIFNYMANNSDNMYINKQVLAKINANLGFLSYLWIAEDKSLDKIWLILE